MLGKKHTEATKEKLRKGSFRAYGTSHAGWKGVDVGYGPLHAWVKKSFGTPTWCQSCLTTTALARIDLANKSGEYKREKTDWMMLCAKCHKRHDNVKRFGVTFRSNSARKRLAFFEKRHGIKVPVSQGWLYPLGFQLP